MRFPILTLSLLSAFVVLPSPASAVMRSTERLPAAVLDSDYYDAGRPSSAKVELGRMLFFDKILSGNENISCATCHHPDLASGDALALPLGEGPSGRGSERRPGGEMSSVVYERVPRNSPALFNVGAREFTRMFHDGRVETDPHGYYEGGFITPAKWKLPTGLENVLAAQALFPPTSSAEMAGQKGENPIADARSLNNVAGRGGVWEQLGRRLQEIPEYVELFRAAFPGRVTAADDVSYVLAANAIAAFETEAFRADDSPFDRYLRGERDALAGEAMEGMELFYGRAGCAGCHSGKFQTDHDFHAIAMPQIGPGKGDGSHADYWRDTGHKAFLEDFGRGRVTRDPADNYRFRTPSLRNVALTGPWGHDGAYDSLEAVVRHHLSPVESLESYELAADTLVPLERVAELTASGSRLGHSWLSDSRMAGFIERDGYVQRHPELRGAIAAANELEPVELDDHEVDCLVAFLNALTDPSSLDLAAVVPESVPSGLPVTD